MPVGDSRVSSDEPLAQRLRAALYRARSLAETIFLQAAERTDQSQGPPETNLSLLAEAGLLGLTTPTQWGGLGGDGCALREYTEVMASACGVTTFVAGQHLSACAQIAASENSSLQERMLPALGRGEWLCGVAFSHLRRPDAPLMSVENLGSRWLFSGVAPWFTGWPLMTHCLLAGTLPDAHFVFAVVPLRNNDEIAASAPMRLCAMNASGTVSLTVSKCYVPKEDTVKVISRRELEEADRNAILGVTPQPLGATAGALRVLRQEGERSSDSVIREAVEVFQERADLLRDEVDRWIRETHHPDYLANALRIRAECIALAVRAAHAAVAAVGGQGNSLNHSAQRILREAMFYTLTAQTTAVRRATLAHLGGGGSWA